MFYYDDLDYDMCYDEVTGDSNNVCDDCETPLCYEATTVPYGSTTVTQDTWWCPRCGG